MHKRKRCNENDISSIDGTGGGDPVYDEAIDVSLKEIKSSQTSDVHYEEVDIGTNKAKQQDDDVIDYELPITEDDCITYVQLNEAYSVLKPTSNVN